MNINGLFRALHALAERQLNDRVYYFLVVGSLYPGFFQPTDITFSVQLACSFRVSLPLVSRGLVVCSE